MHNRKQTVLTKEKLAIVHDAVEAFVKDRVGSRRYKASTSLQKYKGIDGLGFDFNQSSYGFVETTDSVTYFGYIIALNNRTAFEALNDSSMKPVHIRKKVKAMTEAGKYGVSDKPTHRMGGSGGALAPIVPPYNSSWILYH